jgi:hypothetical protein
MRTYTFGHSLIHHEFQINETPSQETSVPHWLHFLTQEAGNQYQIAGQYGFLPQHANLPPFAQWGFDFVAPAWDSDYETFSSVDFDNILITPGNFIQYQGPEVAYYGDINSPLDYTAQIFNWVLIEEPGIEIFIYENWPDMGSFLGSGFPPSSAEWSEYNNYLQGDFHTWFLNYHDSLQTSFPNDCINMIPVGPVISDLLGQSPLNTIPVDTLYEDDAPHGRPTIYFLAAMVTYMAIYDQEPPPTYQVPPIISQVIADNYSLISTLMWQSLESYNNEDLLCNTTCSGDINEDGTVNVEDFLLLNSAFGSSCMSCDEDIDGNGAVNIDDFLLLNSSFGSTCQ